MDGKGDNKVPLLFAEWFLRETSPSLKTGLDISRPPQKNFSAPSVLQIEAVCIMFQYN